LKEEFVEALAVTRENYLAILTVKIKELPSVFLPKKTAEYSSSYIYTRRVHHLTCI